MNVLRIYRCTPQKSLKPTRLRPRPFALFTREIDTRQRDLTLRRLFSCGLHYSGLITLFLYLEQYFSDRRKISFTFFSN